MNDINKKNLFVEIDNTFFVVSVGEYDEDLSFKIKKKEKINCDGLEVKKDEKTFFWSGKYHENMNFRDTLVTELNVLENFNPKIPNDYEDCKYLMLANLMPSIQLKVIKSLPKKPRLIVTDTMNFWIENCLDDLIYVIQKTNVLIINDEEALQISTKNTLIEAAQKIQDMGPEFVIIKKGADGAILFSKNVQFECPSFVVEKCYDPTGAGDTFAGAFIGHLNSSNDLSFNNLKRGIIKACAMASFCVEDFGVNNLLNKSNEEIQKRINYLEERVVN